MVLREKDPIPNRLWIVDMKNAQWTSFCLEGLKVGFTSCLLRDEARDWWKEVCHSLGAEAMTDMSWTDFDSRFRMKFSPTIKAHQLMREVQVLRYTTKIVVEITTTLGEKALLLPQYATYEDEEDKVP